MSRTALIALLVIAALVVGGVFYFRDTTPPTLSLLPGDGPLSPKSPLKLTIEERGAGLKSLSVSLSQGGKVMPLLAREYPFQTFSAEESIELPATGVSDGAITLLVEAVDRAPYHFGKGNIAEEVFSFEFDTKPPIVSILSKAHNINQGGTALIIYDISEEPTRTGVLVGERLFPAHRLDSGHYAALFAFPYDIDPQSFSPQVVAIDRAGNERLTGFYYYDNLKRFTSARIPVSEGFLKARMPQFKPLYPEAGTLLDVFLNVNRRLRTENRASLGTYSQQTASVPLWDGPFIRQPNSATRELFGARRTYLYDGKEIDRQTHLGVDLASVAQGPVNASNRGTVVFAGDFGIYGQCIILDHGLGLQTLYGHLSRMLVEKGDTVEKGDLIGHTGATGLAGGDHLHFGLLVSGLPVNPIEWWDPVWFTNNISSKLNAIQPAGTEPKGDFP